MELHPQSRFDWSPKRKKKQTTKHWICVGTGDPVASTFRRSSFQRPIEEYYPPMTKQSQKSRHFGSDNYAGICPEALKSMLEANAGHEVSYGDDSWTDKASNLLRAVFETDCEVFFVFNGTSANSLSLASLC